MDSIEKSGGSVESGHKVYYDKYFNKFKQYTKKIKNKYT